jgi:hypothetical protein
MIEIETKEATERLKQLQNDLSEKEVRKAIIRALNYSIGKVNTQAKREVRKYYNLPAYNVDKVTKINRANARTLTAAVAAEKSTLSLSAFNPRSVQTGVGKQLTSLKRQKGKTGGIAGKKISRGKTGVYVQIIKGHTEHMPGAFMGFWNKKSSLGESRVSGGAIFARGEYGSKGFNFAKGKHSISKLKSKSIYWSILNTNVGPNVIDKGTLDYEREFVRQITGAIKHGK